MTTGTGGDPAIELVVTIDTEADSMWDRPRQFTFRNSRGLHRLQRIFDERGVRPTYLTTYEVASDPESASFLAAVAESGRGEVGAHLHPWSNPPLERIAEDEDAEHPYPHEYPVDVFERKMVALGDALERRTGVRPRSYRAGRWGFVAAHVPVLARLGYAVDTSVTPGISWERQKGLRSGRGGPNCKGAPRVPYRLGDVDPRVPGTSPIVEIPVSIEWNRPLGPFEAVADRLPARSLLRRALSRTRLLRPVWLRPYPRFTERDVRALCDRLKRRRRPVWNLMFHSSEAVVGASPYARTPQELELWYEKVVAILDRALDAGATPTTLSECARRWGARLPA